MLLKNAWYIAAWSHELEAGALLGRTLLEEPVLLYRLEDGRAVAIGDRCPHRFAPLHLGKHLGDRVRCPYHGLEFDASGRCVRNPHPPGVAVAAAKVPAFPLIEQQGVLWIWLGDPERAGGVAPPRFDCLDRTRYAVGTGYLYGNANYELMVDNILDLSHVEFLHPQLGTEAVSRAQVKTRQDADTVTCIRCMTDEVLPPALQEVYQTGPAPINRTFTVRWQAPATLWMEVKIEPAACAAPPLQSGSEVLHIFTPETLTSTHYFYAGCRNDDIHNHERTARFMRALGAAFENEDKPIIEAQQKMMRTVDLMSLKPVLLSIDAAAVRARRLLAQKIAAENATDKPVESAL